MQIDFMKGNTRNLSERMTTASNDSMGTAVRYINSNIASSVEPNLTAKSYDAIESNVTEEPNISDRLYVATTSSDAAENGIVTECNTTSESIAAAGRSTTTESLSPRKKKWRQTGFTMIPDNIGVDELLVAHPIEQSGFFTYDASHGIVPINNEGQVCGHIFSKDKLAYFIGLVSYGYAFHPDGVDKNNYVRLSSTLMRNVDKGYRNYLGYLIENKVIERSESYSIMKGESYGYRYGEMYASGSLKKYEYSSAGSLASEESSNNKGGGEMPLPYYCSSKTRGEDTSVMSEWIENMPAPWDIDYTTDAMNKVKNEEILASDARADESVRQYPYLAYWYSTGKLEINADAALDCAKRIKQRKLDLGRENWDDNKNALGADGKYKKKNPVIQYAAAQYQIEYLRSKNYNAKISDSNHRLHSVLTNMQKEYRNFVTYDGRRLVNIDIHNSQPYLLCALLSAEFWQRDSGANINLYDLPQDIIRRLTEIPAGATARETIPEMATSIINGNSAAIAEFEKYKAAVGGGLFYESIAEEANSHFHEEIGQSFERKDAKILMMYLLFSSNRGMHGKDNKPDFIDKMKKLFAEKLYPNVAAMLKTVKHNYKITVETTKNAKQHNRLAILLQSLEARIILHRCCKRIWEEGAHKIPIFTIHDSIVTTESNKDFVRGVMESELMKAIGVKPSISIEEWGPEKIPHV